MTGLVCDLKSAKMSETSDSRRKERGEEEEEEEEG
jgi:hypothetical protein